MYLDKPMKDHNLLQAICRTNVDRTVGGYEELMAAQQCLPNNEVRDKFAAECSALGRIWEALSPDPVLNPYDMEYRWLTQVYESVKPPSGNGRLLWHALVAKTVELINENVHIESVRDDVDTLVMGCPGVGRNPEGCRTSEESARN